MDLPQEPSRNFTVCFTKLGGPFAQKFSSLENVPFILDSQPAFHRNGSNYLIDRALGVWPNESAQAAPRRKLSTRSLRGYAEWLCNFLDWAHTRSVDLTACTYASDVGGRYQSEMLSGTWSRNGEPCRPTTVNLRVHAACDFLSWMASKELRPDFPIPMEKVKFVRGFPYGQFGHRAMAATMRRGKVREGRRYLQMPPDVEVASWLNRVETRFGKTKALVCETILCTALRREEVLSLREDVVPTNREEWVIVNPLAPLASQQIRIEIKFGAKGPEYGFDHGDKIGPTRSVLVPLVLAEKWDVYRRTARHRALRKWIYGATSTTERVLRATNSVHLFLDEKTGKRIRGKSIYDAWTGVSLPCTGWSPHQGRHWWCCAILWRELKKHQITENFNSETATALLESTAISIIRLQIQPQLGHADDVTTMIYLSWIMDMISEPIQLLPDEEER